MRTLSLASLCVFTSIASVAASEEFLDRVADALTITTADHTLRARLRGTLDLETYFIDGPVPGLLFTDDRLFLNPRLSLFLDAQLGERVYAFAHARFDRGFDPGDDGAEARLDEYAVRVSPWKDGRFSLQIGKFGTVVGNWVSRHYSWDNPLVTAPLPYENLVGIWDSAAADSLATLLGWAHVQTRPGEFGGDEFADKQLRQPIIWGPSYTSGLAVSGHIGRVDYAAELKNASLSSRPETWDATETQWQHPTFSGRIGYRPNQMWNLGVSASTGSYLRPEAASTIPPGHGLDDYRQTVIGQDIAFAWHHWQLWAEFYQARFEIPRVGNADTFAYYAEAKYKLTPQLFAALRWNQQFFSRIDDDEPRWGRDIWRVDAALAYRHTPHTQLKLQYSLQHEKSAPRAYGHTLAAQLTIRF